MLRAIRRVAVTFRGFLCAAAFVAGLGVGSSTAQEITFQIENSVSLEQIVTAQDVLTAGQPGMVRRSEASLGSTAFISQEGRLNNAQNFTSRSPGASTSTLQIGLNNRSIGAIIDSPGSAIAQLQAGRENFSLVGIVGGADNAVSTLQLGNELGVSVGLVNSTGTKVVYGQVGEGYNGGVVIRNAPPGTVVKLN
ncbi:MULTISPECIES: hypothetical protein [unclassified Sulfitobacter]|uniref:hypothetical protein n=1 Tax=unclassified Sulfitobacter TaxID=196795 RepID=UPI0023E2AC5F|nr:MULTISPECIES: hypothetical protein [unclassified Sulfitobacter]MDF3384594.1 hypothetical protein [Sulfitobacter sp. Ks11]MDF3388083.1 hypothetical protein [Sulfitobacter sp. M85]MDF3391503.1 hypothetical protein [Sulfitobacter sp. Ks16]MDF3402070.1 hypothetical protein [Sulfitobacter sp. KE39]MDF3405562.1 hypothetical protein [Sulfitobacter sp. Ks35]